MIARSYESDEEFVVVMTNPTKEAVKGVSVSCKYPMDTELITGDTYSGENTVIDFEPYDTKFVRSKKR